MRAGGDTFRPPTCRPPPSPNLLHDVGESQRGLPTSCAPASTMVVGARALLVGGRAPRRCCSSPSCSPDDDARLGVNDAGRPTSRLLWLLYRRQLTPRLPSEPPELLHMHCSHGHASAPKSSAACESGKDLLATEIKCAQILSFEVRALASSFSSTLGKLAASS